MLDEVKDFFIWLNIQKNSVCIETLNATCTVLPANTCHSITLLGSQVVWSILMFIFYVDLKLASSLMTCCLLSIVESKLNPSISKDTPRVLEMTGFCTELPSG